MAELTSITMYASAHITHKTSICFANSRHANALSTKAISWGYHHENDATGKQALRHHVMSTANPALNWCMYATKLGTEWDVFSIDANEDMGKSLTVGMCSISQGLQMASSLYR